MIMSIELSPILIIWRKNCGDSDSPFTRNNVVSTENRRFYAAFLAAVFSSPVTYNITQVGAGQAGRPRESETIVSRNNSGTKFGHGVSNPNTTPFCNTASPCVERTVTGCPSEAILRSHSSGVMLKEYGVCLPICRVASPSTIPFGHYVGFRSFTQFKSEFLCPSSFIARSRTSFFSQPLKGWAEYCGD